MTVQVTYTDNLLRHVKLHPTTVAPGTLVAVLEAVFEQFPELKSYILDDQSQLRRHVMLVVDQNIVQSDIQAIPNVQRSLHIMQALSGG